MQNTCGFTLFPSKTYLVKRLLSLKEANYVYILSRSKLAYY